MNMAKGFIEFFYDQGVTSNVMKRAYIYKDQIPSNQIYVLEFLHSGILARLLGIPVYHGNNIEHGEGQIPIWSRAEIQGMNLKEYCKKNALILDKQEKNILTEKVKRMGADIIQGKNVTNYGIATCVSYLANAILNQYSINAPVSTVFQGEYGIADVSLSIPSVIGGNGVEKRLVDENWDDEEIEQLRKVAEKIKGILKMI